MLEYEETTGFAAQILSWSSQCQPKQVTFSFFSFYLLLTFSFPLLLFPSLLPPPPFNFITRLSLNRNCTHAAQQGTPVGEVSQHATTLIKTSEPLFALKLIQLYVLSPPSLSPPSYLLSLSRIYTCRQVNYNWGGGGPAALNGQTDHFSVAWSGLVQPRFSGAYTFYAAYASLLLLLLLLFYLQLLLFTVIVDLMTEHACG